MLIIYLLLYVAKKYNYKDLATVYFVSVGGWFPASDLLCFLYSLLWNLMRYHDFWFFDIISIFCLSLPFLLLPIPNGNCIILKQR